MERLICEQCGARQPADSAGGALCTVCGQGVRAERRCPWCAGWSPAGRFCRACGCELPEPGLFGAARMLKEAGVDRYALGERLRGMDPEQVAVLQRRWEEQRAVVLRRAEEARLCQRFLLQGGFAEEMEETLLGWIPLAEDELASLGGGPAGSFDDPALLPTIAAGSPLAFNRGLAAVALVRRGEETREVMRQTVALLDDDSRLGVEAALALAHWRFNHLPGVWPLTDSRRLARRASGVLSDPGLMAWAAVACALPLRDALGRPWMGQAHEQAREEFERLRPGLVAGMDAADPDLRFACELALGDSGRLLAALSSPDEAVRATAREALARLGVELGRMLREAVDDAERRRLIEHSPGPLGARELEDILAALAGHQILNEVAWDHWRRAAWLQYDSEARRALAAWIERRGSEDLSIAVLLDCLAWACQPASDAGGPTAVVPAEARSFHRAVSAVIERPAAVGRKAIPWGEGLIRWLCGAADPSAHGALSAWARDPAPKVASSLFEHLSALESSCERQEWAEAPRGWALAMQLWGQLAQEERPEVARAMADGWSWGYAQDADGALAALRERYRSCEVERPLLRVAFGGLPGRWGKSFDEWHGEWVPGEPAGGADPLGALLALCRAAPDRMYDNVRLVLDGIRPARAAAVAEALFAELSPRQDTPTQLLPPAVAFARWLDGAAPDPDEPEALLRAVEALSRGWEALTARPGFGRESTDDYYAREKVEEVAGILERVRSRTAGGTPVEPPAGG